MLKWFTLLFIICPRSLLHFKSFFLLFQVFNLPTMKKVPEERLQWRELINRQEDQHLVNYGSPGNSLECVQNNLRNEFWEWERFENEKTTKTYPDPRKNLCFTSTFKQNNKSISLFTNQFSKTGSRTTQFSFTSFEVYSTEIVHSSYSIVESTSTLSYQAP